MLSSWVPFFNGSRDVEQAADSCEPDSIHRNLVPWAECELSTIRNERAGGLAPDLTLGETGGGGSRPCIRKSPLVRQRGRVGRSLRRGLDGRRLAASDRGSGFHTRDAGRLRRASALGAGGGKLSGRANSAECAPGGARNADGADFLDTSHRMHPTKREGASNGNPG